MQRRALVVLSLLVAGLFAALLLLKKEEERATRPEQALFPGLAADAVLRLDVYHLGRGHVALERDRDGRWSLIAPLAYPAERAAVATLLEILTRTRGIPIEDADPAKLGFDPPRIVVEFTTGASGAEAPRKGRLEIGADDVDGVRCFVRAGAAASEELRVVSATRALFTSLDLSPDDYRDRRATWFSARDVVSFRRRGALPLAEGAPPADLTLDALLEPEQGWMSLAPRRAALDPVALGFLVRGAADLLVDAFVDDAPSDLAPYGLEEPRLTVEIEDVRGARATLRFGVHESEPVTVDGAQRWYACREGYPFVWAVDFTSVGLLSAPRAELYDSLIVRALRSDIVGIELASALVTREGDRWIAGSLDGGETYPANTAAVEDLLARLEFARVASFEDEEGDEAEQADERPFQPAGALAVRLADGRRLGGEIELAEEARFRRFGDELIGTVAADVVELFSTPLSALRSNAIHRLVEVELARVQLSRVSEGGGERRASFERSPDEAVWRVAGTAAEAPAAFYSVLERLLFLDAEAWLDGEGEVGGGGEVGEPPELRDAVLVHLSGTFGAKELSFGTAGTGRDARAECRFDGVRARVSEDLLDDLRALLQ